MRDLRFLVVVAVDIFAASGCHLTAQLLDAFDFSTRDIHPNSCHLFRDSSSPIPQATVTSVAASTMSTQDVQSTLRWNILNSLDPHIIDIQGNEIYFSPPSSPTVGLLGVAPAGEHRLSVVFYKRCDANSDSSAFSVTMLADGMSRTFTGEVSRSNTEFQVHNSTP